MQLKPKALIQGLLLTAPIAFGSTIAISPVQAASIAGARGELTLGQFEWTQDATSFEAITRTSTDAIAPVDGSFALVGSDASALSEPQTVQQSSNTLALGFGTNYFATGQGFSQTGIGFDPASGYFQFNFRATLDLLTQADPDANVRGHSFASFKVYKNDDPLTFIDYFKADLWSPTDFQLRLSDTSYINISLLERQEGFAEIAGTYRRKFDDYTGVTVRGFTNAEATVARVPVPPMFAAVILPALSWLKRRNQMKAAPQAVGDRQAD